MSEDKDLKLLSELPMKEYKRIYGRMRLGHIKKHIIDGMIYYDAAEVAAWKPKRRGFRAGSRTKK